MKMKKKRTPHTNRRVTGSWEIKIDRVTSVDEYRARSITRVRSNGSVTNPVTGFRVK